MPKQKLYVVCCSNFTGHAETAHNRIASVVLGFKEALLEEAEKRKDTRKYVRNFPGKRWRAFRISLLLTENISHRYFFSSS